MRELQGLSASPGIAVGTVCLYAQGVTEEVPHYGISEKQLPNELKRLDSAFKTIKESLIEKQEIAENIFGEQGKEILEAHFSILDDPHLRERIRNTIKNERINAEHAISAVFDGYIENLSGQGTRLEEHTDRLWDRCFTGVEDGRHCYR